jgi:hypothetical protein
MKLLALSVLVLCAGSLAAQTSTTITPRAIAFESEGFSMRMQSEAQFRLTIQDERAQTGSSNGRDFANFSVARLGTRFDGHIFDDAFQYTVRLCFTRPADQILEVARFRWALIKLVNLNTGQHKLPWNWEEPAEILNLNFQVRSYANQVFNQDYAKGVWLDGEFGEDVPWLRYWFGIYNGVLRSNEDFRNKDGAVSADRFSALVDAEIMVNARVETHPLGRIEQSLADRRACEEHDRILFAFGAGFNWFSSGVTNADLRGDTASTVTGSGRSRVQQETFAVTVDGHFRFMGIAVDAAVYWRYTDFHNRGSNKYTPRNKQGIGDLEDWGWSFEASYILPMLPLRVAVRVSGLDADEFWGANAALLQTDGHQRAIRPDAMEYGVNASYLFHGERLKFSLDILYVHQQLAYTYDGSATLLGVYNDPLSRRGSVGQSRENSDHDVLWIVRMQIQWLF